MERRDFIKASFVFAAVVASNPALSLSDGHAPRAAGDKVKVFIIRGESLDAVMRLLAPLGGIAGFVKKGSRVLLKANFSFSNPPEAASGTSPALVRTVAQLSKDAGAKSVVVCDNTIRSAKACLERTGIEQALKGMEGVAIITPQRPADYREVEVPSGKSLKKVKIADVYYDSDVYINMPVAKSHSSSVVSLALKNQMGLIYDRASFHSRYDLHQAIADLATVLKPQLTIMDATRCLKTGGPGGPGKIVVPDMLLCSTDMVAIDAYATTIVEWQDRVLRPQDVSHIMQAAAHGVGQADLARIEVVECS